MNQEISKLKILIVDVNQIRREGLKSLLSKNQEYVIGISEEIKGAKKRVDNFTPDVILLNPFFPDTNPDGVKSVQTLRKEFPSAKMIIIDLLPDNSGILRYIKAGVSGFILRDAALSDIEQTIHKITNGQKVFPEKMTGALFSQIRDEGLPEEYSTPSEISRASKTRTREQKPHRQGR